MPADSRSEHPPSGKVFSGAPKKGGGRRRSRWLAVLVLVAACAAGGWYLYAGRDGKVVYTTQTLARGGVTVMVTATGSVQPTQQVDISSEQSGTVRLVNVDYNSVVRKGDLLAMLDTVKLEADVKSAKAKLNSSRANVSKSQAELGSASAVLARLKNLVQNKVSTQQDLDSAQFSRDAAVAAVAINEADVLSSEANLQLAEANLAKARIISPIDGIVLSRAVDPGATVAASLSAPVLFTIAGDLTQMELQVNVDEADVGQVKIGQKATFTVDAFPTLSFPAEIQTIRYVSQTISNVVTYMAVLSVENDKLLLRPGMTATADITVNQVDNTLLIPNAALRYAPPRVSQRSSGLSGLFRPPRRGALTEPEPAGSKRNVWVLRSGVAEPVSVEIGVSDGRFTALVSGDLKEGDAVITDSDRAGG